MKRVLSLVLALVMVLGTLPMAFAADETAGEMLQAAGFVAGDENGNLMEDDSMTRAMLAVLVAELNGVKENAKTYAIAPEFNDVKADDWFGPYVAYAAKEGWFKGDTEGNFNPNGTVSDQTMATVMLRALGYEPAWETAVSEAKAMGLPVGAADASMMTRGEAFATMWGVVNTPKKDSDVALGVELGKIEPAKEEIIELSNEVDNSNTKVFGNSLVNVDFVGSVDAAAAGEVSNYTIVEKADTTKEIAVLSAYVFDGDDVFLETEALEAGKAYTVIVGDYSGNFSGIAKDADKPELDSVKGTDTGEITVVFDEAYVDRATAEDVSNYSLSNEGTIVKAELDSGLVEVTLTVEGMTSSKSQKLTVENVMSTDGVVMSKESRSFGPDFDKSPPKIDDDDHVKASAHNNTEVLIQWYDDHGVDQATAEDVSNYSIDGLDIISAKATYIDDDYDDHYNKVILTTSEQTKSKKYDLEIKYMVDGSSAANATTKVIKEDFRGGDEDEDEPEVQWVKERNMTEIEVMFEEANSLDLATVLDTGNYEFEDGELEVLDVRFDDIDDNGNSYSANVTGKYTGQKSYSANDRGMDPDLKYSVNEDNKDIKVILTVTEMEEGENYKLIIDNIADNYGNVMEDEEKKTVKVDDEITTYYSITNIEANDLEKISVTFEGALDEDTAEDMTNYTIDGNIGNIKRAVLGGANDNVVTLTVPELTLGKTYELTVNNVENLWGFAAEDVKMSFIAANDEEDDTKPEVDDVDYDLKGELTVEFDEPMRGSTGKTVATDSYLTAKLTNATANYTAGKEFRLYLADKIDDDETFIFDAYKVYDVAGTRWVTVGTDITTVGSETYGTELLDQEFTIKSFTNISDLAGNILDYEDGDDEFSMDDEKFDPTDDSDAVEADSASQESGNTIEVVFSRTIKLAKYDGTAVTEESDVVYIPYDTDDSGDDADNGFYGFTFEITGDDDDTILFTKESGSFPDDSVDLQFDFTRMFVSTATGDKDRSNTADIYVTDVLDRASYIDSDMSLTGLTDTSFEDDHIYDHVFVESVDNDDDVEPELEEIEAVDNKTILLHFSEKLKTAGTYRIEYDDEEDDDKHVTISSSSIDVTWDDSDLRDVVKLTLKSKKFMDQDYELFYSSSPRDLNGNAVDDDDDSFTFEATSKTPAVDMVAAKVEGANNIEIINDEDDFTGSVVIEIDGAKADGIFYVKGNDTDESLDVTVPLYYSLLNENKDDATVTYKFRALSGYATGSTIVTDNSKTQSFTGVLDEAEVLNVASTAGATGVVTFECGELDVDKADYEFWLIKKPTFGAAPTYTITEDNVKLTVGTHITEADGVITVKDPSGTLDAGTYKIVAYELDDNVSTGTVKVITDAFVVN